MNLNLVNYTGVPLFIKYNKIGYKIGCGSEKVIPITPSVARFTRFVAKYKGDGIPIKGMINLLLDSSLTKQNIILRAIIDGRAKMISCIQGATLHSGNYTEIKNIQYPIYIFYNISIPIDGSRFAKFKQYLGISISDVGCENRDALLCDKIFGIPVMFILVFVFVIVCITMVVLVIKGLLTK